jgi:hypothetical protein
LVNEVKVCWMRNLVDNVIKKLHSHIFIKNVYV